jgi:hypothetical protein
MHRAFAASMMSARIFCPTTGIAAKPLFPDAKKRFGTRLFCFFRGTQTMHMFLQRKPLGLFALLLAGASTGLCGTANAQTLLTAIDGGKPIIDMRVRYETIDQSNRTKNADALTFRARLGYQTGSYYGFTALADFDFLQHLGADHFCDTERNCTPTSKYPVVADPDMVVLNRFQLAYAFALKDAGTNDTTVTVGRQRINLGNQRFVGNSGWRQHEQTYDAATIVNTSIPKTTLTYSYVTRVNRVYGPDSVTQAGYYDSKSHLINAVYTGFLPYLKLEGFAYLLDLEQAPTLSTSTYGLRAEGSYELSPGLMATAYGSYAKQSDYAKNTLNIDLAYWLIEGGISYDGFSLNAGQEVMEGNGTIGFSTPLATLHPFDGWADVFLTTPKNGIEDAYVKASYTMPAAPLFSKITATVVYHDFSAQRIRADYGSEWDAQLEAKYDDNVTFGLKYADYSTGGVIPTGAQTAAFDKKLVWLYASYVY